jgi:ABC-type transport system involved in multi-copper enzyme maturation permease subunit
MIRDFKNIFLIARYTFVEIYKSKILINIVLIGLAQVIISYVASEFTFGVPQRVALDFGLGTLSLAAVGIAIFMGVNLISKDIENRTIYMVLARPIKRYIFLIGRNVGMMGILFVNITILGALTLALYALLGGKIEPLMYWCLIFAFIEALLVLLVVILVSLVSNTTIAVITTITVYVGGYAVSGLLELPALYSNNFIRYLLKFYSWIFPDLSRLNIKTHVLYQQTIPTEYLGNGLIYGLIYCVVLVLLASLVFQRKNLD